VVSEKKRQGDKKQRHIIFTDECMPVHTQSPWWDIQFHRCGENKHWINLWQCKCLYDKKTARWKNIKWHTDEEY